MDKGALAERLFPGVTGKIGELEAKYPPRNLLEGAKVTRFAPSPTGFVHFGGLLPTRISERLARQSGGVFILRIEDTDQKRRVEGAEENLLETYGYFGITFDEGVLRQGTGGAGQGLSLLLQRGGAERHPRAAGSGRGGSWLLRPVGRMAGRAGGEDPGAAGGGDAFCDPFLQRRGSGAPLQIHRSGEG